MAKNQVLEAIKRLETKMDQKLGCVDQKFGDMELNFARLEHKMDEGFSGVNSRLDMLEEFRRESMNRFDHIFKKLELFNDEYHSINYGIRRIEDDHRIIGHAEILREINSLKAGRNSS
jgi:hypothetical protein